MTTLNIPTKQTVYPFRHRALRFIFACMITFGFILSKPAFSREVAFAQPANRVTVEIRYPGSDASEVFLVWKVLDLDVTEVIQPAGTVVDKGTLQSPMAKDGENFVIQLDLPTWQTLSYSFLKSKDQNGNPINILDNNHGNAYQIDITEQDNTIEVSQAGQVQVTTVPGIPVGTTVIQNIVYQAPVAGEVQLVWGINGWNPLPEGVRPGRTVINKDVMNTPMVKQDGSFTAELHVPVGSTIQYGFFITKLQDGTAIKPVWDDHSKDEIVVKREETKVINSNLILEGKELRNFSQSSLIDQDIRYRANGAGEVFLVWGIDGWNSLPAEFRPNGTIVKDGIMYTAMKQAGGVFSTVLKLPAGTKVDFDFQIVRATNGQEIEVWDSNGDPKQDYHAVVGDGKTVYIRAPVEVVKQIPANNFIFYTGILLGAIVVIMLMIWLVTRRKKRISMNFEQRVV